MNEADQTELLLREFGKRGAAAQAAVDKILGVHRHDPPASKEAARRGARNAVADREMVLQALAYAEWRGMTAFEIDTQYGWESRSGSRAGKRLSELLRTAPPMVARLKAQRGRAHVHVLPQCVNERETV